MVKDKSVGSAVNQLPKADPNLLGELGAPMKGEIVEMKVGVGDKVIKGQKYKHEMEHWKYYSGSEI